MRRLRGRLGCYNLGTMAISDDERFRLRYGPYETPLFRYGATVTDKRWGKVVIVGISNGRIPWPLGKPKGKKGRPSLVLYRGLVKAVRRESNQAIPWSRQEWTQVWYVICDLLLR